MLALYVGLYGPTGQDAGWSLKESRDSECVPLSNAGLPRTQVQLRCLRPQRQLCSIQPGLHLNFLPSLVFK